MAAEKRILDQDVFRLITARLGERPFYLYDHRLIARQARELAGALDGCDLLYSIKTNPQGPIIRLLSRLGFGADAASPAEVDLALAGGLAPGDIFYSSPGKSREDLNETLGKGVIIADSYHELELLNQLAAERRLVLKTGLRVNPDLAMGGGPGGSAKFGVDEESLPERAEFLKSLKHIQISGLHIHLRSQVLEAGILAAYHQKVLQVAALLAETTGAELELINFGGGLGVAYRPGLDPELDLEALGEPCRRFIREYPPGRPPRLLIETGRFLVAEAGDYLTPVVDIKESRGRKYLVVKNGLNGFIRPAIAQLLAEAGWTGERPLQAEPLFTGLDVFGFEIVGRASEPADSDQLEQVSVVGNLCSRTDVLAGRVSLPRAEIGDWLRITNAGAYGYSLSPLSFSSHPAPRQIHLDEHGRITWN